MSVINRRTASSVSSNTAIVSAPEIDLTHETKANSSVCEKDLKDDTVEFAGGEPIEIQNPISCTCNGRQLQSIDTMPESDVWASPKAKRQKVNAARYITRVD